MKLRLYCDSTCRYGSWIELQQKRVHDSGVPPQFTPAKTPKTSKGQRDRRDKKLFHLSSIVKYARKYTTFLPRYLLIRLMGMYMVFEPGRIKIHGFERKPGFVSTFQTSSVVGIGNVCHSLVKIEITTMVKRFHRGFLYFLMERSGYNFFE